MRVVSAATAPSSAKHSSAGRRFGGSPRHRWSNTNTASRPGGLGRARDRDRDLGIFDERRQREADAHAHVEQLPREHRGADRSGPLTELRGHDRDVRPVRGALDVAHERRLQRVEQQRAELHQAAGDHDQLGIEHVRERREPERDVVGVARQQRDRVGVTGARGLLDVHAGDGVDRPAGRGEDRRAATLDRRARAPSGRARCPTRSPPSARARRTRTPGRRARP